MAITNIPAATPFGYSEYTDTNIGNSVDGVKASSTVLYSVVVDNTANSQTTYVRVWNTASGSVVNGTTPPDMILPVFGNKLESFVLASSAGPGIVFGTSLSAAAATTPATGTTAPTSAVTATFNYV
jgi:hypothetical protein